MKSNKVNFHKKLIVFFSGKQKNFIVDENKVCPTTNASNNYKRVVVGRRSNLFHEVGKIDTGRIIIKS